MVQNLILFARITRSLALERKHLVAVHDDAHMALNGAVGVFGNVQRKAPGCVRDELLAQLHEASAPESVPPQLDGRAFDGRAELSAVDCAAERDVAGFENERERSDSDMLREERQLVRAELVVGGGVEYVVTGRQAFRNGTLESLLRIVWLDGQRLLPLLRGLARQVLVLHRVARAAGEFAHRPVFDEFRERDRHEAEVDFRDVLRRHGDFRPWGAPVALRLEGKLLALDLRHDVGALLPAQGLRVLRRELRRELARGNEIAALGNSLRLLRGDDGSDLGLPVVSGNQLVKRRIKSRVARLRRLFVEGVDVLGGFQLGHGERVHVAVFAMERDQLVVEGEPLGKRLVGNRPAIEGNRVSDGEVEKRRAVRLGSRTFIEDRLPVRERLLLELGLVGEHLGELRLERCVDLLRRPGRHLLGGRLFVQLRRLRAAPAPIPRRVLVDMGEVELEHGLERGGLRVDGGRERGDAVLGLVVGKLLCRVLAHEEGARGVGPAPGGDGLAQDLLDLVGDALRKPLAAERSDFLPRPVEVVCGHKPSPCGGARAEGRKHCRFPFHRVLASRVSGR